ncbi:MAG: FCD domain-containing protein, partial [Alphaproteobacteria bacterium]
RSLLALHDALALLGPTTLSVDGRRTKAQQEYRRVFEAIVARDSKTAEAEMRDHVRAGAAIRQELRRIRGGSSI